MYPGEGERVRRRLWLLVLAARIPAVLKKDCPSIANNCIAQLEFVVAHRIRRAQQMFSHYSRMWGDVRLRQIINRITRQFMKRGKEFMIGAAYLSMFKWDSERIPDEEFEKYKDELEICKRLRSVLKGTKSAKGKDEKANPDCKCPSCGCCWDTFIDEEDLSVWKMEEPSHKGSGLYCYKVFGHYDDVTADDFLSVFLDVEHRKEWDAHVVSLYVVDSEQDTNSDLIYWETKWPVMYSNRDYVFIRRYQIDVERKQMTVLNKSTEHADIPQYHNKTRIQEYWSHMVIRPLVDFDKPGIEFSLTYFDNPGAALPTAITLWISATGEIFISSCSIIISSVPSLLSAVKSLSIGSRKLNATLDR
ncbi:hypothetical protein AAG570_003249 [Ranatra chinensis]|uniref:Phosphatidylcholine transfer protein n=1 Tax=Ranatra chinensis TaxID=642074 RepID=A0ABD0YUP6_9HEMI